MNYRSNFVANLLLTCTLFNSVTARAQETNTKQPKQGDVKKLDLNGVDLELVFIPPGEFMMGSSADEKKWATGIEGGAQPGTERESYEGELRPAKVTEGFWMGRTEVSRQQFQQFVVDSGYVTDAEKPGGHTQVFDHSWDRYYYGTKVVHPWKSVTDKSWRDPGFEIPMRGDFPVVCVSYQDMKAFCRWVTARERKAGRITDQLEIRLSTEAEWEYACRGGSSEGHFFWWGDDLMEGKGRLNISAVDFLPGRDTIWPLANAPWSDGFAFLSPVDHYGQKGRNGFGLADMCGGVWEFVLDDFDPKGGHETLHFQDAQKRSVVRPVCRGGNYFDVPGNARCAVRLGIHGVTYSDSRDGFRICLGGTRETVPLIP